MLTCKVRLMKEDAPATAVHVASRALEIGALSRQPLFWPQPTFTKDFLHAFEPARVVGVVFWKIKRLRLPIGE